ncbi:MAG: hypothetical protein KME12_21435 [Trichocoleus desertorum ATA4-8-CV12]|nr:hypothetical protein [Trichocoleus desertorum ATA4-8-CV12]
MTTTDPSTNNSFDSCSAVDLSITQERLRQAHHSFNLVLIVTAASAVMSLGGVIVLFLGHGAEGAITAIAGLASTVHCIELARDANDRLDRVRAERD